MKTTQKIKRKDLKIIYSQVCPNWQKIIAEITMFEEGSEIEVENSLILKAYNKADVEQKKLVTKYFEVKSDKVEDRIKTLKDVYKELSLNREDIIPYKSPKNKLQKAANSFIDISHISLALNQDTTFPDFDNRNQYKYYPWFEKKSSGWVVIYCAAYGYDAAGGFGSYFKTSELALYAGNQFLEVYNDYLP